MKRSGPPPPQGPRRKRKTHENDFPRPQQQVTSPEWVNFQRSLAPPAPPQVAVIQDLLPDPLVKSVPQSVWEYVWKMHTGEKVPLIHDPEQLHQVAEALAVTQRASAGLLKVLAQDPHNTGHVDHCIELWKQRRQFKCQKMEEDGTAHSSGATEVGGKPPGGAPAADQLNMIETPVAPVVRVPSPCSTSEFETQVAELHHGWCDLLGQTAAVDVTQLRGCGTEALK